MAKMKKNKKSYKDLIKEIGLLESIIMYYKNYLERMGLLVENYIEMNKDTEKLVKYIEKKGKKLEDKRDKKT
tara:strand:+ start:524 stop:739 length:216 start_codon:yes stop_codon:yes gene_type:complete